jgi:hypothetical protein
MMGLRRCGRGCEAIHKPDHPMEIAIEAMKSAKIGVDEHLEHVLMCSHSIPVLAIAPKLPKGSKWL